MVTLRLQQLHVPPGHRILIEHVSWPEFAEVVEELGDHNHGAAGVYRVTGTGDLAISQSYVTDLPVAPWSLCRVPRQSDIPTASSD